MCAHAVRVALKAVDGVETVEVSLNRGNAVVTMKPQNNANFGQLQRAITKNGFVINETKLEVAGEILRNSRGELVLKVTGTNDSYSLSFADPNLQKSVEVAAGKRVRLHGTLPPTKVEKMPEALVVDALMRDEDAR